MKHFSLSLLLLFAAGTIVIPASAQAPDSLSCAGRHRAAIVNSTHIIGVGGDVASTDSARALVAQFYLDQFRHFQDPEAPYFMFMSRNANLALGIGGTINVKARYDWNGSIPDEDFVPYEIPIPKDPSSRRKIQGSPSGTSLFLTLLGRQGRLGQFMGYVEGEFSGYKKVGFKLKKAYFTFSDWTVGYARSTFSDPGAEAPLIDGGGINGKVSHTTVLARYMHSFRSGWTIAASVEIPDFGATEIEGQTKKNSAYVPDIAAFGQYSHGDSHVRLAAIFRQLPYRNLLRGKNHSVSGWGVQLSTVLATSRRLTLFASANVGQGISSYSNDLSVDAYDLVDNPDAPGTLYAPTVWSLSAGAQFYWTRNLFSALTVSECRYMPRHRALPDAYKYGLYGAVNIFYNITDRLQAGLEYVVGKRKDFSHAHASADCLYAQLQFSF